jgi:hypothetical protein
MQTVAFLVFVVAGVLLAFHLKLKAKASLFSDMQERAISSVQPGTA